jgi:hypothetical protein
MGIVDSENGPATSLKFQSDIRKACESFFEDELSYVMLHSAYEDDIETAIVYIDDAIESLNTLRYKLVGEDMAIKRKAKRTVS